MDFFVKLTTKKSLKSKSANYGIKDLFYQTGNYSSKKNYIAVYIQGKSTVHIYNVLNIAVKKKLVICEMFSCLCYIGS